MIDVVKPDVDVGNHCWRRRDCWCTLNSTWPEQAVSFEISEEFMKRLLSSNAFALLASPALLNDARINGKFIGMPA